jgi:hypothetical protein
MSVEKWNESGRVWEEEHGLPDAEQVKQMRTRGRGRALPLFCSDADDLEWRIHADTANRQTKTGRSAD